MSCQRLGKKPQHTKKDCNILSKRVQSKVRIPKAIKIILKGFFSTFHFLCHPKPCRAHHFPTTTRPCVLSNDHHVYGENFSTISIQDLFAKHASSDMHGKKIHALEEAERGKEVIDSNDLKGENNDEDAWKIVCTKSPRNQVDVMAEEFISKFREDIRLQKERSLKEFQEMLARSV
ncbi:hypothetical protein TanjilG_02411 [Lupinus angustifolius]|uniref:DUF761 domain-containing protein n=1 Tax=Lupinus angustifolius TaxID=3871 RepID=A0A1J7HP03_LUPAN|nr:PREDICTED: uncharacterized protein LOC109360190 [Lupinus angustifolius]OIW02187.1 hypothetical protein TanjilG_02411 [Lupinus angustifolius]